MKLSDFLQEEIKKVIQEDYSLDVGDVFIEHPDDSRLGDYATNVALKISQSVGQSPMDIAKNICYRLADYDYHCEVSGVKVKLFDSIETAHPGFINFVVSKDWLISVLNSIMQEGARYGGGEKVNEKVMIEYTDPNPFKVLHIGHLFTNTVGESLARLWEFSGYQVRRANYQGDVGMHVAKAIWGMEKKMGDENVTLDDLKKLSLEEKVSFLGDAYSLGAEHFSENAEVTEQVKLLNSYVFVAAQRMLQEEQGWVPIIDYKAQIKDFDAKKFQKVRALYENGRAWSLQNFEELYKILGTKFDFCYFESLVGEFGCDVVNKALEKGIFRRDNGAVIFEGEKYGLHTRVFINSFGFPTYEAKELGLAMKKYDDFKYDRSIVVTGNEIDAYFKVLLKAIELIYPNLSGKIVHVSHGMMRLSSGKMASRTGQVISGMALVEEVTSAVREKVVSSGNIAEAEVDAVSTKIAVGAIKYGILKNGIGKDIVYDKEASLEMTGNTGAYLLYSYVRASSILGKATDKVSFDEVFFEYSGDLVSEELELLRNLYIFPEIVTRATHDFAPNYLCTYLFELSQSFNKFYSACPILDVEDAIKRRFRLVLTKGASSVLQNGLFLLGIETVTGM